MQGSGSHFILYVAELGYSPLKLKYSKYAKIPSQVPPPQRFLHRLMLSKAIQNLLIFLLFCTFLPEQFEVIVRTVRIALEAPFSKNGLWVSWLYSGILWAAMLGTLPGLFAPVRWNALSLPSCLLFNRFIFLLSWHR